MSERSTPRTVGSSLGGSGHTGGPSKRLIVVNDSTGLRVSLVGWCSGTPRKIVATSAWCGGQTERRTGHRLDTAEERGHHAAQPWARADSNRFQQNG